MEPCECHVYAWDSSYIEYCPMHSSAPKLLEALKNLLDYADSVTKPEWVRQQVTASARFAIAEAEGGKHE